MNRVFSIIFLFLFVIPPASAQSLSKTESLKADLQKSKGDTGVVQLYVDLINELKLQSPSEALQYIHKGLSLARQLNYFKGQTDLYSVAGSLYAQVGLPDSAVFYLRKALEISKEHGSLTQEVNSLKKLAEFYLNQGKLDESLDKFNQLEDKAKKAGLSESYAESFSNRGVIYWQKNDPVKAAQYIQKAAGILDTLKPTKELGQAMTAIALLYHEMKRHEKANETYLKIIDLYKKILPGQIKEKNLYDVAASDINIGASYLEISEYDSSLVYLTKAINLAEAIDSKKTMGLAYKKLGTVYMNTKRYVLSENCYLKALDIYKFLKNPFGRLFVLNDMCTLYEKSEQYAKMKSCIKEAITIAQNKGDEAELRSLFLKAASLYEKTGDWEKAYKHRLVYEKLNQNIYNSESNKAMNDLLVKYEADAKEKKNLLLQKENALSLKTIKNQQIVNYSIIGGSILLLLLIFFVFKGIKLQRDNYSLKIKEQETQMVKLNEMKILADLKTLQARINPHFLYNSLNSITSLVHEKPDQAEEMTIKLAKLFRYSINTQEANWASVKEEIAIVQTYLDIERVRFGERIAFNVTADDTILDLMIPRFLLQPLVENALKHGLKDVNSNGILTVSLSDKAEHLEINVFDNGSPFPSDIMVGYGIQSIYDKLNLLCGASWKMNFINKGGKRICIELPKQMTA